MERVTTEQCNDPTTAIKYQAQRAVSLSWSTRAEAKKEK